MRPPLRPHGRARAAGPVVLVVMDGIGHTEVAEGNAVAAAQAPFVQGLSHGPLGGLLRAHGTAVGLPSDQDMGNSEVGHNALGAGQIVAQGAGRVSEALGSGALERGPTWQALVASLRTTGGALHLLGLLSDGNIHSHIDHALALVELADRAGIERCYLHVLLDGRDVPRTSALDYVARLEQTLARIGEAEARDYAIVSGGGRMRITMDRYGADWPMVARGWQTHVEGTGQAFESAAAAIHALRAAEPGVGDQDLPPFVIRRPGTQASAGAPAAMGEPMRDGDAVVLWNFRGDRMLELTAALEDESFAAFARGPRPKLFVAGMTLYDGDTARPKQFLVDPPAIANTLGEALAASKLRQLAISETQKFGHVTYFFNGNRSAAFDPALEEYVEVKSSSAPFAKQPAMQAAAIVEATCARLRATTGHGAPRFVRLNLANGDMVGHTGNFQATVAAVEAVDAALVSLCRVVVAEQRGVLIVTADHGNAEDMFERSKDGQKICTDSQGQPIEKTSHTLNPVPIAIIVPADLASEWVAHRDLKRATLGLANVAATCALLLGLAPDPHWEPALIDFAAKEGSA